MYGKSCSHRRVAEKGGDVVAKLMEVIEKIPNFKKGTVTLKLLDTTFSQLTRKIGSQSGKLFQTVETGDMLSKEVLQSLNAYQLALKERLLEWKMFYDTEVAAKQAKGIEIGDFNYTFTSVIDYTSKYEANKTLADYYLLTEFVNAEKELYEFGHYWAKNHMLNLLSQAKEWSKDKVYGSCVGEVGVEYETFHTYHGWKILETADLEVKISKQPDDSHDKCWLYVSELQKIKINETKIIKIQCFDRRGNSNNSTGVGYGYLQITRKSLNVTFDITDDGYFEFKAWGEHIDKVRSAPRVTQWTGVGSSYFDIKNPTLKIIRGLVLLNK